RRIWALKERRQVGLLAEIHYNTGKIYLDALGDWELAADHFGEALQYLDPSTEIWLRQHRDALYYGLAKAKMELGALDESEDILQKMLAEGVHLITRETQVISTLADIHLLREHYSQAESLYLQYLSQPAGYGIIGREARARMMNRLGLMYLRQQEFRKAKDVFADILRVIHMDTVLERHDLAMVFGGLGYALTETGEYEDAIPYLVRAIDLNAQGIAQVAQAGMHNGMVYHYLLAKAYFGMAEGGHDQKFTVYALQAIDSAMKFQDILILNAPGRNEESMIRLQDNVDLYAFALEVTWHGRLSSGRRDFTEQAFRYMEDSRSMSLKKMMMEEQAIHAREIPDTLVRELRHWRNTLAHYERLIYEESRQTSHGPEMLNHWEGKIRECRSRIGDLTAVLLSEHPEYSRLMQKEAGLSLQQVINRLLPEETVLLYTISGDSAMFVMSIDASGARVERVPLSDHFPKLVAHLREMIASPRLDRHKPEDINDFQDVAHQLYGLLVSSAGPLKGSNTLTVVPDGLINYVPFEVLVKNPAQGLRSYHDPDYLLKHYTITYTYSLNLRFASRYEPMNRLKVAAFAPEYGQDAERLIGVGPGFNPLPGALEEIKAIRRQVRGRDYTGRFATETAFRAEAGKGVVLHLAMHAQVIPDHPVFSSFVFADAGDQQDDHFLNGHEIFQMEIRSPMVVMSACNSGFGAVRGREGLMNLGRGFLKAGVPAVVMSHWNVDDLSGSVMMPLFYKFLNDGEPSGAALQKAKLEFLDSADGLRAHPYFWSAPVLYGNPGPLTTGSRRTFLIFVAIGAILLFAGGLGIWQRRLACTSGGKRMDHRPSAVMNFSARIL
ncbi:MAG: CHAT domain-containing tetratricopeptide repeat protein, partial [Bacteroidales bacterium]